MAADLFQSEYTGETNFPGTDCTPAAFTASSFLNCPDAYTVIEGEIDRIWITNVVKDATTGQWEPATDPVDHTDPGAGGLGAAGFTKFVGWGNKPLAEVITVPLPTRAGRVLTTNRKHTLNFRFTDMHADNYAAVRELQGSQYVALWYADIDGNGYGGAKGIIARVVNAGNVHVEGENAPLEGQLIFEWYHLIDPPKYALDPPALLKAKVQAPEPLKSGKKAPAQEELATA